MFPFWPHGIILKLKRALEEIPRVVVNDQIIPVTHVKPGDQILSRLVGKTKFYSMKDHIIRTEVDTHRKVVSINNLGRRASSVQSFVYQDYLYCLDYYDTVLILKKEDRQGTRVIWTEGNQIGDIQAICLSGNFLYVVLRTACTINCELKCLNLKTFQFTSIVAFEDESVRLILHNSNFYTSKSQLNLSGQHRDLPSSFYNPISTKHGLVNLSRNFLSILDEEKWVIRTIHLRKEINFLTNMVSYGDFIYGILGKGMNIINILTGEVS